MITREYAINVINTLSDEQIDKLIKIAHVLGFSKVAEEEQPKEKRASAMGIANKYANPDLIPFEKGAWERAVIEKYEQNHNS